MKKKATKPAKKKLTKISSAELKKVKGGAAYTSVKNVPTGYSGWSPTTVGYRPGSGGGSRGGGSSGGSGSNRARAGK